MKFIFTPSPPGWDNVPPYGLFFWKASLTCYYSFFSYLCLIDINSHTALSLKQVTGDYSKAYCPFLWDMSIHKIVNLFTIMLTRNSSYIKVVSLLITTLMWRVQIKRWHIEISLLSDWSPISVKIIIKFLHKLDLSPDTELITYLPNVSRHKMWITYYNIPT